MQQRLHQLFAPVIGCLDTDTAVLDINADQIKAIELAQPVFDCVGAAPPLDVFNFDNVLHAISKKRSINRQVHHE